MDTSTRPPLEVLGLPKTSTREEIDSRYRSLAFRNHPDRGGNAETLRELNEAYAALEGRPGPVGPPREFIYTPDRRTLVIRALTTENAKAEIERYKIWIKGCEAQMDAARANAKHKHWAPDHKGLIEQLKILQGRLDGFHADVRDIESVLD